MIYLGVVAGGWLFLRLLCRPIEFAIGEQDKESHHDSYYEEF